MAVDHHKSPDDPPPEISGMFGSGEIDSGTPVRVWRSSLIFSTFEGGASRVRVLSLGIWDRGKGRLKTLEKKSDSHPTSPTYVPDNVR
ncbi:uncharacterized protein A4U43_C03F20780 [Asparagus officinalis]|uniref:Uncharacterized protein n=1 Tax=Asparagus officinalis TaxID=4686 RepID=A0A5P1FGV4_ASPOF|nr:uncharacterized protein A4U43_C03F20780 [Asparagus officinalis]